MSQDPTIRAELAPHHERHMSLLVKMRAIMAGLANHYGMFVNTVYVLSSDTLTTNPEPMLEFLKTNTATDLKVRIDLVNQIFKPWLEMDAQLP